MDFTRKSRWVLYGHKTHDPIGSTYVGVLSRDSIRVAFTYASLDGLDLFTVNIRDVYIHAHSLKKYFIICGKDFSLDNIGKKVLIRRELYGGKSDGSYFRNHLCACMRHMYFMYFPSDPDVWMQPTNKNDGSEYYDYDILYTDGVIIVRKNAGIVLR